tara:strand:- start:1209 stop:1409 length:201 start_codon:yes stop_codon:yes gene_type:complete
MSQPHITKAEITLIEKLYKLWAKLETSHNAATATKANTISATICAALPRLLAEVKRLKKIEEELEK